jgi:hypothetical protein
MSFNRYSKLTMVVLLIAMSASAVFASADDRGRKRPRNMGTLSIKTTDASFPVRIDGRDVGMTGVGEYAEFFLTPGIHTVEVLGPDGKVWVEEIEIRRNANHCICLRIVRETITTPCPYRFYLEGPQRVTEGDLVTFAAINAGTAPIPLRYSWRVTPSNARITSGLGTPTITVDTTGLGGSNITAELDVNDDTYDEKCRQLISTTTEVTRIPPPVAPQPFRCDEFEAKAPDDDKARFDNCVIQAQNTPDAQLYIIIYPGTDRLSTTRNTYDRLSKRALDYIVKTRGFDPRRITIVRGSNRPRTMYEIWIVPPGAQLPVPQ